MKRKGFFLENVIKITCLLNRKEHKAVTICFLKIMYIQSMKKYTYTVNGIRKK